MISRFLKVSIALCICLGMSACDDGGKDSSKRECETKADCPNAFWFECSSEGKCIDLRTIECMNDEDCEDPSKPVCSSEGKCVDKSGLSVMASMVLEERAIAESVRY